MSVIDDLLATMASLSGNKNVVFIFDPKQYEPVESTFTPGACVPDISNIDGDRYDSVVAEQVYSVTYMVSGDLSREPTTLTFFSDSGIKAGLLTNMAEAINSDLSTLEEFSSDFIDLYGGTVAYFTIGDRYGIYGGDGSAGGSGEEGVGGSGNPVTLELFLTSGADYDAVATLFGADVSLSSCGLQYWPGW